MKAEGGNAPESVPTASDTSRHNFQKEDASTGLPGWLVVWLSGVSALVYFLASYGIRNHLAYLADAFEKVARAVGLT